MSSLTRYQRRQDLSQWPFGGWFGLENELDRLFQPFGEVVSRVWNPALDLYQDKDNVIVKAELPGLKKEDIDVSLHDGTLTISGERKMEEEFKDAETFRSERFVGRFQRSVTLPTSVNVDKVKADYKDGILTVTMPKTEEAKPRQIAVNVG